jgi:excisionase family DNA binding protein
MEKPVTSDSGNLDGERRLPYWPAALNKKLAAAYSGLSPEIFDKVCPVEPISFTASSRGHRFLRQRLDEWLVSIDPNKEVAAPKKSMVELMYGSDRPQPKLDSRPFTLKTFAQRWRCSERHVRNMIAEGQLPAHKLGGKLLRIMLDDIESFEESGGVPK